MRKHVKHDGIALSTFMKYLPFLTERVQRAISAILKSKFVLVLDGWTCGQTHYLGMFTSFHTSSAFVYGVRLLALSPICDESILDAAEHVSSIKYILGVHRKHLGNVFALLEIILQQKKLSLTNFPLL